MLQTGESKVAQEKAEAAVSGETVDKAQPASAQQGKEQPGSEQAAQDEQKENEEAAAKPNPAEGSADPKKVAAQEKQERDDAQEVKTAEQLKLCELAAAHALEQIRNGKVGG